MRDGRHHFLLGVVALTSLLQGCADSEPSQPTFEVSDSSGVEVVLSYAEAGFEAPWALSEAPLLRLGKGREEEPYLFGAIRDATRLSDGSVVVFENQSLELRRFDSLGTHLGSFGGKGDGPGEFSSSWGGIERWGDTILKQDNDGSVSRFSPTGKLIKQTGGNFWPGEGSISRGDWNGVLPSGALWGVRLLSLSEHPMGVVHRAPLEVVISDPARTEVTVLGEYGGQASFRTQWMSGYYPVFISLPTVSREPLGILVGNNEGFTIDLFDAEGTHLRRMKYLGGDSPPGAEQLEELRAATLALHEAREARGRGFPNFRRWLAEIPDPDVWPGFSTLLGDELGYTWAFEYLPTDFLSTQYVGVTSGMRKTLLFHPRGFLAGSIEIPANLTVFEVGRDFVLGRLTDDLGVHELVLYGLSRG